MRKFPLLTCHCPAYLESSLTEALAAWPVLGCQVEDVTPDTVLVTVYLSPGHGDALPEIARRLEALGAQGVTVGLLPDADWLGEYRRSVTPRAVGRRFWIDPHPTAPTPAPPGRVHLLVEPRQAFGTGSHESTALVLECLEEMELAGRRVLDVGTGSSILALAAAALGACPVVGFDIDLEAIFVARQTVRAQTKCLPVALFGGEVAALSPAARFDVVLANLLPSQLDPILPEVRSRLAGGGELVISGFLVGQRAAMVASLKDLGLAVVHARTMGEWVAVRCRTSRRGP